VDDRGLKPRGSGESVRPLRPVEVRGHSPRKNFEILHENRHILLPPLALFAKIWGRKDTLAPSIVTDGQSPLAPGIDASDVV